MWKVISVVVFAKGKRRKEKGERNGETERGGPICICREDMNYEETENVINY